MWRQLFRTLGSQSLPSYQQPMVCGISLTYINNYINTKAPGWMIRLACYYVLKNERKYKSRSYHTDATFIQIKSVMENGTQGKTNQLEGKKLLQENIDGIYNGIATLPHIRTSVEIDEFELITFYLGPKKSYLLEIVEIDEVDSKRPDNTMTSREQYRSPLILSFCEVKLHDNGTDAMSGPDFYSLIERVEITAIQTLNQLPHLLRYLSFLERIYQIYHSFCSMLGVDDMDEYVVISRNTLE
ncbi:hypothetical protein BDA99DRAFT_533223 [Phascolomyces articulosus]|uniref:Uncharacterized protein n=1 Tax=Phascolomyces articulosus TaxID=60185 RepID=A0AAD5PHS4_9FUNG|nr:hypothetical protein BDA99DRAFT_533223 [Phascolomyces articulosus]